MTEGMHELLAAQEVQRYHGMTFADVNADLMRRYRIGEITGQTRCLILKLLFLPRRTAPTPAPEPDASVVPGAPQGYGKQSAPFGTEYVGKSGVIYNLFPRKRGLRRG
jgi:hypothetical protein